MSDKLPKDHPFTVWMNHLPATSLLVPDDIILASTCRVALFFNGDTGMYRAKNLQTQIVPESMHVSIVDLVPHRVEAGVTLILLLRGLSDDQSSEYPESDPWSSETRIMVAPVSGFQESAEERIARIHRDIIHPVVVQPIKIPLKGIREAVVY